MLTSIEGFSWWFRIRAELETHHLIPSRGDVSGNIFLITRNSAGHHTELQKNPHGNPTAIDLITGGLGLCGFSSKRV